MEIKKKKTHNENFVINALKVHFIYFLKTKGNGNFFFLLLSAENTLKTFSYSLKCAMMQWTVVLIKV